MDSLFQVFQNGPLPFQTTFNSPLVGPALVFLSGSAWRNAPGATTLVMTIDGSPVAKTAISMNEATSHHAFPAVFAEVHVASGQHTLELTLSDSDGQTVSDVYDHFCAAVFFF